ncbi:MAG: hypothetical protein ACI9RO_000723 [Alteromonas macleodii]|jgi:hypothetical protein
MSVGVSLSGGKGATDVVDDLGELVSAANLALYTAKSDGRNKVSLSAARSRVTRQYPTTRRGGTFLIFAQLAHMSYWRAR